MIDRRKLNSRARLRSRFAACGGALLPAVAYADMGPAIVVPFVVLFLVQLLLLLALLAPKRMADDRGTAAAVFGVLCGVGWLYVLNRPADSFAAFYPVAAVTVVTFVSQWLYYRKN